MKNTSNGDKEQQIIAAARQVFMEKGFAEASMSDIAARAGVKRPGLHYYFRTKERMFEAVCGDIINTFLPLVQDVIMKDSPLEERIAGITDVYLDLLTRNPGLPLFMAKEVRRDPRHFIQVLDRIGARKRFLRIGRFMKAGMKAGMIREVPLECVFYTFYGLMVFPFLAQPLAEVVFDAPERDGQEALDGWKEHVVRHMEFLLHP